MEVIRAHQISLLPCKPNILPSLVRYSIWVFCHHLSMICWPIRAYTPSEEATPTEQAIPSEEAIPTKQLCLMRRLLQQRSRLLSRALGDHSRAIVST
ncbi:hypothetical protein CK203_024974 [Vitis vinifera]|uniref:Uncharacterized protein n=1 Tax=Vitis vinifera TaxID=29760 RepID=A0A438J795_VITVI|nr:hypothetical protein CK203_024974 [Vitis vinifera]